MFMPGDTLRARVSYRPIAPNFLDAGDVFVVLETYGNTGVYGWERIRYHVYRTGYVGVMTNPLSIADWLSPDDLT